MGLPIHRIPENIRRCMAPETRKELNAPTHSEVDEKMVRAMEKELHEEFEKWCKLNSIPFIHSRMDKKSTIQAGHPDFTLLHQGWTCCVEFKTLHGSLSEEQEVRIQELRNVGIRCLVTADLAAAIRFSKETLGLPIS